jgi:hypothetical protein
MADQIDPEQIQRASEALEKLINGFGDGFNKSKTLDEKRRDAQERFGKDLGKAAANLGSSLYKGEKGVGQFGDAVEMAANAIQTAILAIPGIGIAAKLATLAIVAFAKGINAAAKQGDALYKSYQDLSRAGATASDGISGVFRNMQNLGYGIEELDKMVALVTQNSETLAKFSLTAADGTNAFAQGMAQIQRDGGLRLLGKTTDDINSAGAAFIRQNVKAGISQTQVGNQLGAQTKAYILELDRLQRLTGTSADALQKQQDEAMAEDAYNDVMSELKQRALAGDEVAKEQMKKIGAVMASLSPEMQKEFQKSIGGDLSAQQKLFMRMPTLMKNVMDESVSVGETMGSAKKDIDNFVTTFGKSYRVNAEGMKEVAGGLASAREEQLQFANYDERNKAAAAGAKVQDTATKALTEAQIANMNTRDALQSMVQLGVAPATVALSKMAQAAGVATGAAAGATGAPGGGAATGGAGRGPSLLERIGGALGMGGAKMSDLRVKSSEAYGGGETSQQLMTVAKTIQDKLGGDLRYFSAFNDTYERGGNSLHSKGRALDFTLTDPSKAAAVASMIGSIPGISKVIDEYANPSRSATGGHIHAEISAANGAVLSGPMSGYRPNLTMHGTEAIVPLNSPAAQSAFGGSDSTNLMSAQLDKLDELVRVMQNQVNVSNKILQAAN